MRFRIVRPMPVTTAAAGISAKFKRGPGAITCVAAEELAAAGAAASEPPTGSESDR
jgi:hypothetical protein